MGFRIPYRLLAAALLLGLIPFEAPANEGHDHDAPAAKISVPAAPRAEASSELFELVAISRSGELTIYLDRFATNEPVPDAAISVETPQGNVEARPRPTARTKCPLPGPFPAADTT
jgi:membrane fusion protein, heavy metal efflux system